MYSPRSKAPVDGNKLLKRFEQEAMSDATTEVSEKRKPVPRNRKSLIEFYYVDDYIISPYRVFFDITTTDVMNRMYKSIWPFDRTPLFLGQREDLYGPIWIYLTLNVFGNI